MGGSTDDSVSDADREWRLVAQRHFDPAKSMELTAAVVYAIADARDVEPTAITSVPLYESVDLAALEATFFGPRTAERDDVGVTSFRYDGHRIDVKSDGWITVFDPAGTDAGSIDPLE